MKQDPQNQEVFWLSIRMPDTNEAIIRFELVSGSSTKLRELTKITLKFIVLNQWASTLCSLFTYLIAN